MNIIAKLTFRHLAENKKRTIVTILGIAISTALISAILLGVFSFFSFFGTISRQTDGTVDAAFYELTEEQVHSLKSDSRIASAGFTDTDPEISGLRLDSGKEKRHRTGNIAHADRDYYLALVNSDYEGTLPSNSSEIAVEEQFLKDNGLTLRIGDPLTFEQGYRYTREGGELVYLAGSYRSEEAFEALSTETCVITAILHGNRPTSGFDILRGTNAGSFPARKYTEVRISLRNCDHTAIRRIKEIAEEYGIRKYAINTEYMLSVFAFEGGTGDYGSFFVLMAIGLLVVIVTSVTLIVNSLGMSLAERMWYLGMLASVGATGRQKRFSIYSEGLMLGAVGIPLGLLMGLIGTKITLAVLGAKILEADIISGAEGMRGTIPIVCAPWVIFAVILFSGITIFLSTLAQALKAAKIMPVDAIRQNTTIKISAKSLRVNPLVRRIFGCEGELACKNIKRNGIKGTVITISIAVSVVLFLTINFFCEAIRKANQYDFDMPCQIVASCSLPESEKLRSALEEMDGVDRVFHGGTIQFLFEKRQDENCVLADREIADPKFLTPGYAKLHLTGMDLVLIDDADFKELLKANGLPEERYFGGTLRGVLLNNYFREKPSDEVFTPEILGQSLHYDEAEGFPPAVEIGDFVKYDKNNYIFGMTPKGAVTVFAPASVYYEKAVETIPEETLTCDLCVVTKRHEEICQNIYQLFETEGYHNYSCTDMAAYLAIMNTVTLLLKTAMYGFSILLTLIAVANIVNTISTGVLMRRKEFAMYKSVGMTGGGFRKMIRLETFLYGIRALLIGIPASLLISYLMHKAFEGKLYVFAPDWIMYAAVTAAVFAVVGLSMLLSVNRLKDDSIIEALKEDAV
ncbi:MAG: FtsX-like permease family protein [Eubacteriales bacterium]|nr:FtsX-like permease family protein [Eubacteriales bacterium]